jgi:signal transduction histidine kinase
MSSVTAVTDQRAEQAGPLPYPAWRETIALPSLARAGQHPVKKIGLRLLREPFTGRAIRERQYSLLGFALAVPGFVFVVVTLGASLGWTSGGPGALIGVPLLIGSLLTARWFGGVHRAIAAGLLRLRIEPPAPARQQRPGVLGWGLATLTDSANWRAIAYLLIRLPVLTLAGLMVATFWIYGLPFLVFPAWWAILHATVSGPVHLAPWLSGWWDPAWVGLAVQPVGAAFALVPLGAYLVFSAPWKIRALVLMDGALINRLLGPARVPQRVRDLEQTRAQAVDGAAARLRKIERDLHDGAQAQMVAVVMKLGLAREKLGGAPGGQAGSAGAAGSGGAAPDVGRAHADLERALELVDAAHASAREAIIELRDLARGIHPPVLDHGLGTALATLAASSAIPVEVVVDLPERPSAAIETIAYFCAAELLANVAKHSGAHHAMLEAVHVPGLLRVRVTDDGAGGARFQAGGGLAGLAERLRPVDGKLEISSPQGGPTVVTVEMPSQA